MVKSGKMAAMCCAAALLVAAGAFAQSLPRREDVNAVALSACQRLRTANTLNDIDAILSQMEASDLLLLRNAVNQARSESQLALFSAAGLDTQRLQWIEERERAGRALAALRAGGGSGRDSHPAVRLASEDIARMQGIRAERAALANAVVSAVNALVLYDTNYGDDPLRDTTVERATLETNIGTAKEALANHIVRTDFASFDEIDAAIERRTAERATQLGNYDNLRIADAQQDIARLDSQIADAVSRIARLREEAESLRQASWHAHYAEIDVRNCAVMRGRVLGASGAPRRPGPPPYQPPQPPVPPVPPSGGYATPPPSPPPAAQTAAPSAVRLQTHSAYAAPTDSSGWTLGQSMQIDLTFHGDGSVTGSMSGAGGAVLGSLSGRWSNGSARGRIALTDGVLGVPGSGGGGGWTLSFPSAVQPQSSGAWCILPGGSDRRVGRQFGMIYQPGASIVIQRSTTDPLCS